MELYNSKEVKTRKQTRCFICGVTILPKTVCHYESGKYDGEMFSRHSHNECSKEWSRQNREQEYGDEWFDLFSDGTREELLAWKQMIRDKYQLESME
jgi:hypothetical protein